MIDPSATSLSLLQRIRNGEAAGWRRVVDLYAPLVQHWCRRWGVQAADADDLVQEVFQAASLGIATFSHDRTGDTFRGWLHTIARHKAMDFWRRYEQRPDVFGGSEALMRMQQVPDTDSDTNAEDPQDADQISAVFHRALGLLRGEFEERTWQAFWRATVDGLSAPEVAAELGMTASAVRMAKSRVLRRLREELGDLVG
jgi:RNA polymerase sigma-70 factor, ECF subfamily